MTPEERAKVLVMHNLGSRVKTVTESITEAMVTVDPSQAIRAAENRKAEVFTLVKTSHELISRKGGSRRTDPKQNRETSSMPSKQSSKTYEIGGCFQYLRDTSITSCWREAW